MITDRPRVTSPRLLAGLLSGLVSMTLIATACSSGSTATGSGATDAATTTPSAASALRPLHAVRGTDARVSDDQGRQVLLRGVNLNGFGDYYQNNPAYPATIPVTDDDWSEMAKQGFDVVRLLVTWSSLEPTRGTIDQGYLDTIHAAVDAAAAHGIYSVIDMHQDAYSKYVGTPAGVTCPDGTEPGIGWDGAPDWATLTDGADTCATAGIRELAPAVIRAFENFYADTDGIQTELTKTWAAVATEFAGVDSVAGYDLFNEPNWGADSKTGGARLGAFTQRTTAAIRAAERDAGGFSHIVFFEPVVIYPVDNTTPPADTVSDPNMVFAPHNYAESIDRGSIDDKFATVSATAQQYGTTFWIGEYGWWDATAENAAKAVRYAAAEDRYRVGGTWWQWKQACGDPHSVGATNGTPANEIIQYTRNGCPGDVDRGVIDAWKPAMTRAYPRSAPGTITKLASDPATGGFTMTATRGDAAAADVSAEPLDLWFPDRGHGAPAVTGTGIGPVDVRTVAGGYRVTAPVTAPGDYSVTYAPA